MRSNAVIYLLALALVGCGPKPVVTHMVSTQPVPVAAGYFRNSGEGFSFDLPTSWKSVAAGKVLDPAALFLMGSPGKSVGITKSIDEGEKAVVMTLVDTDVKVQATDAPVMVKVRAETVKDGANLKDQADQFQGFVYDVVKAKRSTVTIPAGEAIKFTATRKFMTGDLFYFVDYILVDGEKVVKLNFCGNEPTQIEKIADACVQTFRIDPAAKTTFQQEKEQSIGSIMDAARAAGDSSVPVAPPDSAPGQ